MPTGAECLFGTQFPPPATSLDTGKPLHGFCESTNTGYQHADCPFAVVDRLVVPADLAEGDWVLSFRWGAPNPRPQPAYLLCVHGFAGGRARLRNRRAIYSENGR